MKNEKLLKDTKIIIFILLLILLVLAIKDSNAAGEFTKPTSIQPAISSEIADPDDYNQNIAAQSKDSIVGIDVDGNYADANIGDETLITNGALAKDLKVRTGNSLKIYDGSGVLGNNITWDSAYNRLSQATETNQGTAEVATQAETDAGTSDTLIVTPSKLASYVSSAAGGGIKSMQVFTSSGTWTKPSGVNKVLVKIVGGGAGGGGCANGSSTGGGGGGGGGFAEKIIVSGLGSTETITIGSGGGGGGATGSAGGTSSFGSHFSATGGSGGTGSASACTGTKAGGAGGTGSGTLNFTGVSGNNGASSNVGGAGGMSYQFFYPFGKNAETNSTNGINGQLYGGGGNGSGNAGTGGTGAAGIIIVYEYS